MTIDVREIPAGATRSAAAALGALRPRWSDPPELVAFVDGTLRPAGYRLVGTFDPGGDEATSVAGFRVAAALAWGRYLYVDDLSTLPAHRGHGHADALLSWLAAEAARCGCVGLHLDSGVGADRAPAHRLYMRHHLRISAHHFEKAVAQN